ncbi:MAG: hypothetical protein K5678_05160 [Acetatifactor sp.]|nr:hypothetical protein [Acetatifactor sp.]
MGEKNVIDKQLKIYFLTQNNPETYGLTRDQIIETIHGLKNLEYFCLADEKGSTLHTHILLIFSKKKRWSAVQHKFPHAHIETQVRGTAEECRAYIKKEGEKYKDKADTNIANSFYEEGEPPSNRIPDNHKEMLLKIEEMLDEGMRPNEIMEISILYRQYENIIRKQFFAKRVKETPPLRDIKIIWHLGESGSGKSFTYTKLCEEYGEDDVFFASDYANRCTALMDGYEAQKYLFLDEIKEDSFSYGYLLQLFQGYKAQLHSRYNNVFSLYVQIDATSIFTPDELYDAMVPISNRDVDSKTQLLRRITDYAYHWKTDDGEYHVYQIPASEYKGYADLRQRAEESLGFQTLDGPSPFDE